MPAETHDLPLTGIAEGNTVHDINVPEASLSKDLRDVMATQYCPTCGVAETAVLPRKGLHEVDCSLQCQIKVWIKPQAL